jgi:hypothetical protein
MLTVALIEIKRIRFSLIVGFVYLVLLMGLFGTTIGSRFGLF